MVSSLRRSYLAWRRVATQRFVTFDAAGTMIWLAVIVPIGFMGGRGLDRAGIDLTHFEVGFAVVALCAAAVRAAMLWRKRR